MTDGLEFVYGSVCSGIEAVTVAWHPLGWRAAFYAEIDKFPSAVLRHHHPGVPNAGDFTKIKGDEYGTIDALVGGTPCQDFSVAGLRAGMDGQRGQLTVEFARLAHRMAAAARTRWLVFENVPGILSIDDGGAFAIFLGLLAGVSLRVPGGGWGNSGIVPSGDGGFGLAWRVLDAQYAGVPQRRRRVFVVGYFGDWRRAAAVLFERHSLSGHPPPRREARQVTPTLPARSTAGGGLGTDFDCDGGLDESAVTEPICMSTGQTSAEIGIGIGTTLNCNHEAPILAHSLRADGFDASEDGTGRGTPLVPVYTRFYSIMPQNSGKDYKAREVEVAQPLMAGGPVGGNQGGDFIVDCQGDKAAAITTMTDPSAQFIAFSCKDHGADAGDTSPTLRAMGHSGSHANAGGQVAIAIQNATRGKDHNGLGISDDGTMYTLDQGSQHAVAFAQNQEGDVLTGDVMHSLGTNSNATGRNAPCVAIQTYQKAVRRLTPLECCRLQGFPDNYFDFTIKGKPLADGPIYKSLGNSMAVPCMSWIGQRIQMVERILCDADMGAAHRGRTERKNGIGGTA